MVRMLPRGALICAAMLVLGAAHAEYPDKAIRFLCLSAAGSSLDAMARMVGKELGDELKQPIVVEDKPGGTGAVGMATARNLPADGYTLVTATGSTSFMMADPASDYKPADFIFLRGLQAEASAVAVAKDSPYNSMKELIEAMRKTPEKINVGGFAAAGFHQYVFYRLQQAAKFRNVWVPFDGGNQAVSALLGKHIDAAIITPSSALGQLKNGDIRLLGISTDKRDNYFPDVPTFKEQGYDVVEMLWRGVMVKAGTPPDVLKILNAALDRMEARAEWKKFQSNNLQSPMGLSMEQMQKHVLDEVASRRKFLQEIKLIKQ
ncbi:MAG TPA: tripartite tricarboxylate transporter substrate binding protein [Burkholderiales bacterium]|jgi:tripartite-type tricarboxylate transporter receptor subunit TctC|nr:tripartite tricarboxylate transporter substrate binding protein [Burkholderiales bacterium]